MASSLPLSEALIKQFNHAGPVQGYSSGTNQNSITKIYIFSKILYFPWAEKQEKNRAKWRFFTSEYAKVAVSFSFTLQSDIK